jgi:transcriptional regulator with XRE-family HTH domain
MSEGKILQRFGEHVKAFRLGLHLSQEQLASRCELDRTYISGIERGKRNLSLLNIVKLASALKVPTSDLMDFEKKLSDE